MDLTDAVKTYYDVLTEFKLLHKSKNRGKYLVTFNTELYFFTAWFRKLIYFLRYNTVIEPEENINTELYPETDWNIFTDEPYGDPKDCHGTTLEQQIRFIIGSFVELMIKIDQTPPSQPDTTYEYIINSNLKYLHQYLTLRDKYIQHTKDICIYSLLREETISYGVQCFQKHIEKDNSPIEISIILASNPLRRAMEYV
jgi:hypothetical protein